MKRLFRLLSVVMAAAVVCSCVSSKKIKYFQGDEEMFQQAVQIMQQYEMRLKPADQVLVKVTCSEPDLLTIFSQDVMMGTAGTTSNMSTISNGISNAYGYTVTNDGHLILPAVGRVKVEGCTSEEAATKIENKIREANLIKDPEVTVRLLNARVAVLGAVKVPQIVSLHSERNTILDVLSSCGDVSDSGLRQNIKLYREVDGQRKMYDIDLTKADVFNNPAYYVQQNDLIYVEPNKSQRVKSSAFYTAFSASAGIISLVASLVSVTIAVVNATK